MSKEEEYQFPNEEYTGSSAEEPSVSSSSVEDAVIIDDDIDDADSNERQSSGGVFGKLKTGLASIDFLKHKRVIIILLVVVVGVVVFNFIDKPSSQLQPVAKNKSAATTQQAAVTQTQQPAVTQTLSSQAQTELSQLKLLLNQQQTAITQVGQQMNQFTTSLGTVAREHQQLSGAVTSLGKKVAELSQKIDALHKKPSKKEPVVKSKKVVVPKVTYYLRALVPGRAWIQNAKGQSRSVSVGNTLPQYGTVIAINPQRGIVLTSSGRLIRYGKND